MENFFVNWTYRLGLWEMIKLQSGECVGEDDIVQIENVCGRLWRVA